MTAARLYLRCLAWGLATGAVAGGAPAAVLGMLAFAGTGEARLALLAIVGGVFYGTLVAVVPSVVGGMAVVVVLSRRHPRPASYQSVHRDLGVVFAIVVALLDATVLVLWLLLGGLSTVHVVLMVVLVVDAVVALMLKPARSAIARAWLASDRDGSGSSRRRGSAAVPTRRVRLVTAGLRCVGDANAGAAESGG